ncbi:MAG: sodium:calcium antiporter, partial [Pirellulaceae bacterium]|nr:sodium:calcium antiporter [Pirellulaceae bacterium]
MEHLIEPYVIGQSLWILLGIVAVTIFVLGKSADTMIDEAVTISIRSGLPRVIIGATIVSLGTTMPEATVSVLAAFDGKPGMALGNAVGSVICDTGLILGLACLISPLPLNRALVNRQGWVQFGAGLLLVLACIPWNDPASVYSEQSGAVLHQATGWFFLVLLAVYMIWSVSLAKLAGESPSSTDDPDTPAEGNSKSSLAKPIMRLLVGTLFLVFSSAVLITCAQELAVEHFNVPIAIIAATIVAFGTSLPELVTALTAVRKNQGELAIGNVIGADILNIL